MNEKALKRETLESNVAKTPSEWAGLAQEAENEERWSDAHYFWIKGSMTSTEGKKEMQLKALQVFEKWQNSSGK